MNPVNLLPQLHFKLLNESTFFRIAPEEMPVWPQVNNRITAEKIPAWKPVKLVIPLK